MLVPKSDSHFCEQSSFQCYLCIAIWQLVVISKGKTFFLRLFKFSPYWGLKIEVFWHIFKKIINFKRFSINSAIDFNFCIFIFLFIIALFLFYFKRLIENRLLGSLVLLSLPMQKAQVRLLTEAIYFCVFYYSNQGVDSNFMVFVDFLIFLKVLWLNAKTKNVITIAIHALKKLFWSRSNFSKTHESLYRKAFSRISNARNRFLA